MHEPAQELLGIAAHLEVPRDFEQGHRPPSHPPSLPPQAGQAQRHFFELGEIDGLGQDVVDGLTDEAGQGVDVEGARDHQDRDVEVGLPHPLDEVVAAAVAEKVVDQDQVEGRPGVGGEPSAMAARRDRLPPLWW